MVVLADGSIYGTIGGGALEKHIIDLCIDAIGKGKSSSIHLPLNREGGRDDMWWRSRCIYRSI